MRHCYAAYGLQLRSSFPLVGMQPSAGEDLPQLELDLVPPRAAGLTLSTAGPPMWSGLLGDGTRLTIERDTRGRTVFSNGERAQFELERTGLRLACAPAEPGPAWQRTLLGKVLPSISVMRGYEALHAAALQSPWGAVAIAAPSGMGKTTLALELARRGWPLISDDVLALASTYAGVLAYPGTPHMNLAHDPAGEPPRGIARTLALLAGERWLAARRTAREPHQLRTICLLERGPNLTLEAQTLPRSPLPLSPYMLGLPGDETRERTRFSLYADLADSATLVRLTGEETATPGDLADLLEHAAAPQPTATAAGAAR